MQHSDLPGRSTKRAALSPPAMVSVVNNVAQLSQLKSKSNSKYRWFKRLSLTTAPRILIIGITFFAVAFLLAATVVNSVLADSSSPPKSAHSDESLSPRVPAKKNKTSLHMPPSPSTRKVHPPNFHTIASSLNTKRPDQLKAASSIAADFKTVITEFMDTAPNDQYSESLIREHFENDDNNSHQTTMLVTIANGEATFTHHFPASRHGRAPSVKYIVPKLLEDRKKRGGRPMPNVTFMVMVNDGHRPRVAMFGSARHWRAWTSLIPAPLGNLRGVAEGWGTPLEGWDDYVKDQIMSTHVKYPWVSKISKAMFRGALGMQSYTLGSCNWENRGACKRAVSWKEVNRGVMYLKALIDPQVFDIGFTATRGRPSAPSNAMDDAPEVADDISFQDFQKYKYLLNVGSNQDWAERLRCLLFTNSAVVMHEAETQEFFSPLLQPWEHYIPTDVMFSDLVSNVRWAVENDDAVRRIVDNQHLFARRYLSESAMQLYWEIALEQFALRQQAAATGIDTQAMYNQ